MKTNSYIYQFKILNVKDNVTVTSNAEFINSENNTAKYIHKKILKLAIADAKKNNYIVTETDILFNFISLVNTRET